MATPRSARRKTRFAAIVRSIAAFVDCSDGVVLSLRTAPPSRRRHPSGHDFRASLNGDNLSISTRRSLFPLEVSRGSVISVGCGWSKCPSQPQRERRGDQHVIDSTRSPHVAALTDVRHLDVLHRSRTPRASATRRELYLIWPRIRAASVLFERAVLPTELKDLELVLLTSEGSWWVLWLCAISLQRAEPVGRKRRPSKPRLCSRDARWCSARTSAR